MTTIIPELANTQLPDCHPRWRKGLPGVERSRMTDPSRGSTRIGERPDSQVNLPQRGS
jgi:hypothetical protein